MNKTLNIFKIICLTFLIISCEKESFLEVSQSSISFTEKGGSQVVIFSTNKTWTVSVTKGGSWCKVSPTNGNSNSASITITVEPNKSIDNKSATISISSSEITRNIEITQEANIQLLVLTAIYNNTNGENWKRKSNWLSDRQISEWEGIEVNQEGNVIKINLSDNNLSGTIPKQIGDLKDVIEIRMNNNNITGNLPPEFSNLQKLIYLDLTDNKLIGKLPQSVKEMTNFLSVVLGGITTQQNGYGLTDLYDGITIDGVTWAPVNVGYDVHHKNGLMFQWHRKYGQTHESEMPLLMVSSEPINLVEGNSLQNKNKFFTDNSLTMWTAQYVNWDMDNLYNPCPTGWRVPKISEFENLQKYGRTVLGAIGNSNLPGEYMGPDHSTTRKNSVFLPYSGRLDINGNSTNVADDGYYWAIESSRLFARCFVITKSGIITNSSSDKRFGYSIRCVKE